MGLISFMLVAFFYIFCIILGIKTILYIEITEQSEFHSFIAPEYIISPTALSRCTVGLWQSQKAFNSFHIGLIIREMGSTLAVDRE